MKLVEVIEFSSTDCSDVHATVSIIVTALHRAGSVKNHDCIRYRDDGNKVRVYIYRPEQNGSDGDDEV